jgi:hypothetical protein
MNWYSIVQIEAVKTRLNNLGYKMLPAKYRQDGLIGIYPADDKNPLYSRDAEVFCGTVEDITAWVRGIEHQSGYLKMLKATSDKKIKALEEKYVKTRLQKAAVDKIKDGSTKIDKHTQELIDIKK